MGKFIALIDILGFKEIVQNNSHQEVIDLFDNFRVYVQMSIANHKAREDEYGRAVFDVRESPINSTIISDSLIFWTNDNSTADFFELVEVLQRFLSFCHSLPFIFLRGGITYGDFHFHYTGVIRGKNSTMIHSLMVGKALVEAYEIEKKLEIAGCIITDNAIEAARNFNPAAFQTKWDELTSANKLLQYNMPLKKGGTENQWTLNWVKEAGHPTLQELTEGFSSFNKSTQVKEVQEKIKNTVNYFLKVKNEIFNQSPN